MDHSPTGFRRDQRRLAAAVEAPGWRIEVPELYAEFRGTSRTEDVPAGRTWNEHSEGATRTPVGLLRLVHPSPKAKGISDGDSLVPLGSHVKLWPNGAGAVVLTYQLPEGATEDIGRLRSLVNLSRAELSRTALDIALEATNAVHAAVETAGLGVECCQPLSVRLVGRHRLLRIDAEPTQAFLETVSRELAIVGHHAEFTNSIGTGRVFHYAGNGVSLEIAIGVREIPSVLAPLLEYYEYWVATTTTIDDQLHDLFVRLSQVDRSDEIDSDRLKNQAREAFFTHADVVTAMSPQHHTAWKTLMDRWRLVELEADIRDKILAIEESSRSLRESVANRVAARTSRIVTFLTALTLVSIITGAAAFTLYPESRLTTPMRLWLALVSGIAAILLFTLSLRPLVIRRHRGISRRSFWPSAMGLSGGRAASAERPDR